MRRTRCPYGRLRLRFNANAAKDRASNNTNGAAEVPKVMLRLLQAVAMNEAKIKLQFITLKLDAKYFCP